MCIVCGRVGDLRPVERASPTTNVFSPAFLVMVGHWTHRHVVLSEQPNGPDHEADYLAAIPCVAVNRHGVWRSAGTIAVAFPRLIRKEDLTVGTFAHAFPLTEE